MLQETFGAIRLAANRQRLARAAARAQAGLRRKAGATMKTSTLLAACAVLVSAGAANAQALDAEAVNRSDVRCFLAMGALGQNAQYKDAATVGSFYFAGRIEGRNPDFDLKRAARLEAGRMGAQEYVGEIKRCGDLVKAKGGEMTDMLQHRSRGIGD